jgi:hypothetical protein
MEKNKAIKYAEQDTLPAKIDSKSEMVLISIHTYGGRFARCLKNGE